MGLSNRAQPGYASDFAFGQSQARKMVPAFLAASDLQPAQVVCTPVGRPSVKPLPSTLPVARLGKAGAPERWAPFARAVGAILASPNPAIDGLADGLTAGFNDARLHIENAFDVLKLRLLGRDLSYGSAWRPEVDPRSERRNARVLLETLASAPIATVDIRRVFSESTRTPMASLHKPLLITFTNPSKPVLDLGEAAKHLQDVGEKARVDLQRAACEELVHLDQRKLFTVRNTLVGVGVLPDPDGSVSDQVLALVQPRFSLTPYAIERKVQDHFHLPAVVVPDIITVDRSTQDRIALITAVASRQLINVPTAPALSL